MNPMRIVDIVRVDILGHLTCRRRGHHWYHAGSYSICERCHEWHHHDLPTYHPREGTW